MRAMKLTIDGYGSGLLDLIRYDMAVGVVRIEAERWGQRSCARRRWVDGVGGAVTEMGRR